MRQTGWLETLTGLLADRRLTAHGPTGADYFGFVRGMWGNLPPVFMGRAMCDQALLHYCLRQHIPLIDGTLAVVNVHQYHGYQHVAGGRQQVFYGDDRETMARGHGLRHSLPTVADAQWRIDPSGQILPDRQRRRFLRRAEFQFRYGQRTEALAMTLRALQYVSGKRSIQPAQWPAELILTSWHQ